MQYILTFDQGTSSSRSIIFDKKAKIVSMAQQENLQIYPSKNLVEQDPEEIFKSQIDTAKKAIFVAKIGAADIVGIGITNQRESIIIWDKATGNPIYNAIIWQDKRTRKYCKELRKAHSDVVRNKTGLFIDPYFSATKIRWILDNVDGARERAERGELLFGTIDTWLVWKLTKGRLHITDVSNASRTMVFNINSLQWDNDLLKLFNIPKNMLPEIKSSSEIYGVTDKEIFGIEISIAAIAGDQQAALFGQLAIEKGMMKNTFGTGCFMLMNTGNKPHFSNNRLLTTVAWKIDEKTTYALEGNVFIAGAAIKWLRDKVNMIDSTLETETLAKSVSDSSQVFVIPTLSGLGAPYWKSKMNGAIFGLTLNTTKAHIVRATLESIAFRSKDIIKLMKKDSMLKITSLSVDGGASANNFLMQFLSDLLNIPVKRPEVVETTALGVAYLAGLSTKFWTMKEIKENHQQNMIFFPSENSAIANKSYRKWKKLVKKMIQ
ncbi:MAG: glycerol kinase [Bacteroidetes bacterium CG2_30_33_31]|nr:MAG: glycerol kinase [Bacteroidetes bacterium CG2_30_33_31]